ncbi:DUF4240 domain-containing protein [Streptomyces sp. NPDC020412]|uniref:DUF4240 domain-containing protein n=1 Tax=Streptomyces sp. NPDC020412 TaxID=3365073 RepID=UPI0037B047FF
MDLTEFWRIVETARSTATADRPFDAALVDVLATRPASDVLAYEERFEEMTAAIYRWDVWAAAYLIGGGCSDDSFMDFRAGLVALGREWYEKASARPDALAENPVVAEDATVGGVDYVFYEEVNYAARTAYERITGAEDFYEACTRHRAARGEEDRTPVDMGEEFDFDDEAEMHRRFPRLSALFLDDDGTHESGDAA